MSPDGQVSNLLELFEFQLFLQFILLIIIIIINCLNSFSFLGHITSLFCILFDS